MHISSASSKKSRDASGLFEALVQIVGAAENADVLPVFFAQFANLLDGGFQAFGVARHAAVIPDDFAELAVERIDGALPVDREQLLDRLLDAGNGVAHFGMRLADRFRACLLAR